MYANTQSMAVGDSLYGGGQAYPYDPNLDGIFDVITAPFRAAAKGAGKVGKFVGRTVVRAAPRAVAGFVAGGPAGAAVGAASSFVGGGEPAVGAPDALPDAYYDASTGRMVQTPPLLPPSRTTMRGRRISVPQILDTAYQAATGAARTEATRQLTPHVEPMVRPIVEQRLKERAFDVGKFLVPAALIGIALLRKG